MKCLVDVGGRTGSSLALITARYPHIRGINYDLPHVAAASPAYPGLEHIGGNMFESVPSGDAIFMKFILHDWNDSECVTILRNGFNVTSERRKRDCSGVGVSGFGTAIPVWCKSDSYIMHVSDDAVVRLGRRQGANVARVSANR